MLVAERLACLQLDDERIVEHDVGEVLSDDGAIFVPYRNCLLLRCLESGPFEAMNQSVLIDLLQIPISVVDVNVV